MTTWSFWEKFIAIFGALASLVATFFLGYQLGQQNGVTATSTIWEKTHIAAIQSHTIEKDSLLSEISHLQVSVGDTATFLNKKIAELKNQNNQLQNIVISQKKVILDLKSQRDNLAIQINDLKKQYGVESEAFKTRYSDLELKNREVEKQMKTINDSLSNAENKLSENTKTISTLNLLNESNADKQKRINSGLKFYEKALKYEIEGDRTGLFRSKKTRIEAYEEAVKNYALAESYGVANSTSRKKDVIYKKDVLDKDDEPGVTIKN